MTDAQTLLMHLAGKPLYTLTRERPNRVLRLDGSRVLVATEKSPEGKLIPIAWIQAAIYELERHGELRINKETLGHRRTAFIGAVLRELPRVEVLKDPQRLRVKQ